MPSVMHISGNPFNAGSSQAYSWDSVYMDNNTLGGLHLQWITHQINTPSPPLQPTQTVPISNNDLTFSTQPGAVNHNIFQSNLVSQNPVPPPSTVSFDIAEEVVDNYQYNTTFLDWMVGKLNSDAFETENYASDHCWSICRNEQGWDTHKFVKHWNKAVTIAKGKAALKNRQAFLETPFLKIFRGRGIKGCKGEIGIEIEAEGKNLFSTPIQYWNAVSDGSLRAVDNHPPLEYVLRSPIERKEVMLALKYLSNQLKHNKSELMMSHRCSVHVHVNIQQMPMQHLINFMSLYFILEDVLVEWSGPERKGNLFCLRAKDADWQIELLTKSIKQDAWPHAFDQEYRYSAMNCASMGNHGSLEFRSMRGNVDIEHINNWVIMLTSIKDAACSVKNPASLSRMFQSLGPRPFLMKVLDGYMPRNLIEELLKYSNLDTMMWDSYRTVRDLCHCIDWDKPPKYMLPIKGEVEEKRKVVKKKSPGWASLTSSVEEF